MHTHTSCHTLYYKAFMHTLILPTHTYKVSLLCCKSTEFLPDAICPLLLFQDIMGIEKQAKKQYQPLFIWMRIFQTAKHQNHGTILLERLIMQEWSQTGRGSWKGKVWGSSVLMCKAPFTPHENPVLLRIDKGLFCNVKVLLEHLSRSNGPACDLGNYEIAFSTPAM